MKINSTYSKKCNFSSKITIKLIFFYNILTLLIHVNQNQQNITLLERSRKNWSIQVHTLTIEHFDRTHSRYGSLHGSTKPHTIP